MSLDQRAKILQAVTRSSSYGVKDLTNTLNMKCSNLISLLRTMEQEKLIEVQPVKSRMKGRPKKKFMPTSLGRDFLDTHTKLDLKRLRSSKSDLDRAVKDAQFTQRLVDRGHLPFQFFIELNDIARNVKNSA